MHVFVKMSPFRVPLSHFSLLSPSSSRFCSARSYLSLHFARRVVQVPSSEPAGALAVPCDFSWIYLCLFFLPRASLYLLIYVSSRHEISPIASYHGALSPCVTCGARRGRLRSRPGRRRYLVIFNGFYLCITFSLRASLYFSIRRSDRSDYSLVVSYHGVLSPCVTCGARRGRLRSRPGRWRYFEIFHGFNCFSL
jgi:hypothetical protein